LTDEVREYARESIEKLVKQKEELEILELNVQPDHVHLLLWIPPKYSVASVMGYLKGKLAIRILQRYEKLGKKYWGRLRGSRGYCVSTIGSGRRAHPRIRQMAGKEGAGNGTVTRRIVR
jgi:putative transposase